MQQLVRDGHGQKQWVSFEDNLCFFRCLAMRLGCVTWVIPMRLVDGKGDAGAESRELGTDACYVFMSSLDVVSVKM